MYFKGKYGFLSNDYNIDPMCVIINGTPMYFVNVISAFLAQKDPNRAYEFQYLSPEQAKTLADEIKPCEEFLKDDIGIMYRLLSGKFHKSPLKEKILDIDEPFIYENNEGDTYWGVDSSGKGDNYLGELLAQVQKQLILKENIT